MERFIDSSDDLIRSKDWIHTNTEIYPIIFQSLGLKPENVKKLFDAGSGYGASLVSSARYFSQSELFACSIEDTPTQEVVEELKERLHFSEIALKDFLNGANERFDLIIVSWVPSHGLTSEKDYSLLSEHVERGGTVITFGDTSLDPVFMQKYFEKTVTDQKMLEMCAWQKKKLM